MILSYIDPTTTSTLLYVIIGVSATIGYACRGFFYKAKDFFLSSKARNDRLEDDLVFYSEGRQYWPVFEPVLKALDEKDYVVIPCSKEFSGADGSLLELLKLLLKIIAQQQKTTQS